MTNKHLSHRKLPVYDLKVCAGAERFRNVRCTTSTCHVHGNQSVAVSVDRIRCDYDCSGSHEANMDGKLSPVCSNTELMMLSLK